MCGATCAYAASNASRPRETVVTDNLYSIHLIKRWAVVVFYAAVTGVMAAPFFNYGALASATYEGDARLIVWTLAWDNHAVLSGRSLFDSNIFYPAAHSLAYNEHLFGLSLFTLPLYAATANPVAAYNIVWLASFLLNGLAAHALLKRHTGRELAAIGGSLVFTFSFYKMLHAHGHLHLVWTWLIPVSIVAFERWVENPSFARAAAWAAAMVLQSLTSWYLAVITVIAHIIVFVCLLPELARRSLFRPLWQLGAVATLSTAIVWPFAAPYRALAQSERTEVAAYSADLAGYIVPPANTWVGQLWLKHVGPGPGWIWGERTIFIGWTALAIAALGVLRLWRLQRHRLLLLYAACAAVGFILSLGPSTSDGGESWSAFRLLSSLPGMGAFRAPARFALLVVLGVAGLTAFGVDFLATHVRRATVVLYLLFAVMLSEWYVVASPAGKPQPFFIPDIYRTEAVASARALVSLPDYRGAPDWFRGGDYLYYSTAHWRPIVNGFGRAEPPDHQHVLSHMRAFPGPNNARTMRTLGVEYVVFHAARQPQGSQTIIDDALKMSDDYELVARDGEDYLFKVRSRP
jgi:hypothetical protein